MADLRAAIIAEARSWIGTPYRHQGSLKGVGCDCAGLIRGVWLGLFGTAPATPLAYSSTWADASEEETMLDAARRHMLERAIAEREPGDVLVFRWRPHLPAKHCAILVEPFRIVHAYQAAGKVAEGTLAWEWERRIAGVFAFPASGEAG